MPTKTIETVAKKKLSLREKELVIHVQKGFTRSEIAERMAMSIHTYDKYRKNIRAKLELKTKMDWATLIVQFSDGDNSHFKK
jgi:DNA-binding CsgD family transcriptional regulator